MTNTAIVIRPSVIGCNPPGGRIWRGSAAASIVNEQRCARVVNRNENPRRGLGDFAAVFEVASSAARCIVQKVAELLAERCITPS